MASAPQLPTGTVTLGQLLEAEDLALEAVTGPRAAELVPVSWVHATEQLDPRPHLKPNELVCTLGSMLVRPEAAAGFASTLKAAGVSALGLGLGEVHLAPPHELIEACERAALPLIVVPHGTAFLSINEAILRLREELHDMQRSREARVLTHLLALARDGASGESVLAEFGSALDLRLESHALADAWNRGSLHSVLEGASVSAECRDQLASILQFCASEAERYTVEAERRIGQLFELIERGLAHPAALASHRDPSANWTAPVQVTAWPSGSEEALRQYCPDGMIGTTSDFVAMVAKPRPELELRELRLLCGFSSAVEVGNLRRGLSEARSALRTARVRGGVAGPQDLLSLESLLEQLPTDALMRFVEHLYDPLAKSDRNHQTQYVPTLQGFLESGQHLQRTADRMHVHVNTVRHRLQRIAQLTGRDPLAHAGLVDLRIAMWAHQRRRAISTRMVRPLPI